MRRFLFWVRWSLRDLRRRWVQVVVIALVIAIGTGVYAGLTSAMDWRKLSYDASYVKLRAHDIRVKLPSGSYVTRGTLSGALAGMRRPERVSASEERLIAPTQIEARALDGPLLVPGKIVGVALGEGAPGVDGIELTGGSWPDRTNGAVLETHFADQNKLAASGTLLLPGRIPVRYTGTGLSPEYFMVTSGQGDFLAQADFAVLFVPLEEAQAITGHAGMVNDLVIALRPGSDTAQAVKDVESALSSSMPGLGFDVETIQDDPAHRLLYQDLNNDRGTTVAMAFLVLIAAAFAAFTLTGRVVEAERREMGIDMALGVRRTRIAIRPVLGAAWIAALGAVFGVAIGFLFVGLLRSVFMGLQPLPSWLTPLEAGPFLTAAAIGFILPFAASVWPVWRAVRVEPIDAIRTGHLAARGGGLAPVIKKLHLPGKSLVQMPFRNLVRAPRRTLLTAIGIGAAIVTLVVMAGSIDSFDRTLARTASELRSGKKDRMVVTLAGFQPADSPQVKKIEELDSVGGYQEGIVLGAKVSRGGSSLDVQLQLMDPEGAIWHPTVTSRVEPGGLPGIVLSSKAARDLGLKPGDTVQVRHPFRVAETLFSLQTSRMRLTGEHANPMRFLAYTDISNAGVFGLSGMINEIQVVPAPGYSRADVKRDLFGSPGVAVVQEPAAAIEMTGDQLKSFSGVFRVVEAFALFLALLIAFNAASIGVDERLRDNATMMAFGVRVKTLLRMSVQEGAVLGVLGSLVGLGLGILALNWLIARSAATLPELELAVWLRPVTIVAVIAFGVLVVALAPLFTARRLLKVDVPSTLRIME